MWSEDIYMSSSQIDTEESFGVEPTQDTSVHEEPIEVEKTQEASEPENVQVATEKIPEVEKTPDTDKLAKNTGCEAVGVLGLTGEDLSSKVNATVTGSEDEKREADKTDNVKEETEVDALNNNKVDVDIEPDVKANDVKINLCSLSCIFNCFSGNKRESTK
jgi:hypothetical protein